MDPLYVSVNKCRVCGSEQISEPIIFKSYYLINLEQTIDLDYVVCEDCQFLFSGKYVGDAYLEKYYKKSPMLRRNSPTKFEVDQNKRQASFISSHIDITGFSVLEIGAHAGAFLEHLQKYFKCNVYFDEMSDEAVQVLSSKKGFINYKTNLSLVKVDLIIIRHVLEHIFDLDKFVNYIRSILNDDGYLFIEVPDWSWLDNKTDPFIFEHLNHFNTHNIIYLMRRLGWQCEAIEKSVNENDPATPNRVQRFLYRPTKVPNLYNKEIIKKIKKFYSDNYGQANSSLNLLLDNIPENTRIALYPASHLTFSALNETNLKKNNVIGMFDIDKKKHGKIINDIEIFDAKKLKELTPDIIFLFTMAYEQEIKDSFSKMGIESKVISITDLINNKIKMKLGK
jgi:SAM-dependent methyltransferase